MYKRILLVIASVLTASSLLLSSPPAVEAAASCPFAPDGYLCETSCLLNTQGACASFFGRFGCSVYNATCYESAACQTAQPCCNMSTGQGCEGSLPYCDTVEIHCQLY